MSHYLHQVGLWRLPQCLDHADLQGCLISAVPITWHDRHYVPQRYLQVADLYRPACSRLKGPPLQTLRDVEATTKLQLKQQGSFHIHI